MTFIERLFPAQVDNTYRGHPLALWVFVLLTIVTVGRSLVHMFASDGGAMSIASITLDAFSQPAADTVITMFALWGISQLLIGLLFVIVIWRYRALIPLMYLIILLEYFLRLTTRFYTPGIALEQVPPGAIANIVLVLLTPIMLVLSLRGAQSATA